MISGRIYPSKSQASTIPAFGKKLIILPNLNCDHFCGSDIGLRDEADKMWLDTSEYGATNADGIPQDV